MSATLSAGRPWQHGYALVGFAQLALAMSFAATRRRWPEASGAAAHGSSAASVHVTLRLPGTHLGVAAFFCYVGIEASAGAWIYTLLSEGRGSSTAAAATKNSRIRY